MNTLSPGYVLINRPTMDHADGNRRYTIRLLVAEVSSTDQSIQVEVIENTCNLFEICMFRFLNVSNETAANSFASKHL